VIEAADPGAEMFGEERLKAAVTAHGHLPAQVVCERVLERVTAHSGAVAQRDDITLVCIQAK
jgi:serine phosphatase RsbU (regulator of sigma subunit)